MVCTCTYVNRISLSLALPSLRLSFSLTVFLSLCMYVSFSLSISVCITLSRSLSLSLSLSLALRLFLWIFLFFLLFYVIFLRFVWFWGRRGGLSDDHAGIHVALFSFISSLCTNLPLDYMSKSQLHFLKANPCPPLSLQVRTGWRMQPMLALNVINP